MTFNAKTQKRNTSLPWHSHIIFGTVRCDPFDFHRKMLNIFMLYLFLRRFRVEIKKMYHIKWTTDRPTDYSMTTLCCLCVSSRKFQINMCLWIWYDMPRRSSQCAVSDASVTRRRRRRRRICFALLLEVGFFMHEATSCCSFCHSIKLHSHNCPSWSSIIRIY